MTSPIQKILFGSPGTGKSFTIKDKLLPALGINPNDDDGNYKSKWVYSQLSNIGKKYNSANKKGWNELLHIEFDLNNRIYDGYIVEHIERHEDLLLERYPCPDLVLEPKPFDLEIIDYKDVPLELYTI